jgi:hypothetical protein
MTKNFKVPSGTTEPYLFAGPSAVPDGTRMSFCTIFPSVKTLGYCQSAEMLNTNRAEAHLSKLVGLNNGAGSGRRSS